MPHTVRHAEIGKRFPFPFFAKRCSLHIAPKQGLSLLGSYWLSRRAVATQIKLWMGTLRQAQRPLRVVIFCSTSDLALGWSAWDRPALQSASSPAQQRILAA